MPNAAMAAAAVAARNRCFMESLRVVPAAQNQTLRAPESRNRHYAGKRHAVNYTAWEFSQHLARRLS